MSYRHNFAVEFYLLTFSFIISILALVLFRCLWSCYRNRPPSPERLERRQRLEEALAAEEEARRNNELNFMIQFNGEEARIAQSN